MGRLFVLVLPLGLPPNPAARGWLATKDTRDTKKESRCLTTEGTDHTEWKDTITAMVLLEAGVTAPKWACPVGSVGWRGSENGLTGLLDFFGGCLGLVAPNRGDSPQAFGGRPYRPAEAFLEGVFHELSEVCEGRSKPEKLTQHSAVR